MLVERNIKFGREIGLTQYIYVIEVPHLYAFEQWVGLATFQL